MLRKVTLTILILSLMFSSVLLSSCKKKGESEVISSDPIVPTAPTEAVTSAPEEKIDTNTTIHSIIQGMDFIVSYNVVGKRAYIYEPPLEDIDPSCSRVTVIPGMDKLDELGSITFDTPIEVYKFEDGRKLEITGIEKSEKGLTLLTNSLDTHFMTVGAVCIFFGDKASYGNPRGSIMPVLDEELSEDPNWVYFYDKFVMTEFDPINDEQRAAVDKLLIESGREGFDPSECYFYIQYRLRYWDHNIKSFQG